MSEKVALTAHLFGSDTGKYLYFQLSVVI